MKQCIQKEPTSTNTPEFLIISLVGISPEPHSSISHQNLHSLRYLTRITLFDISPESLSSIFTRLLKYISDKLHWNVSFTALEMASQTSYLYSLNQRKGILLPTKFSGMNAANRIKPAASHKAGTPLLKNWKKLEWLLTDQLSLSRNEDNSTYITIRTH